VAELTLDHDEWYSLMRHLDRVRVPQLVRSESPPDARCGRRLVELLAGSGRLPTPPGGRSVDDTEQRADRELASDLEPRIELVPGPAVHPDLAPLAAFPAADEHGAAGCVQIALLEAERLADPQPGTPEQHDQRAEPMSLGSITDGSHDRDDLFDGRRVGRILLALVPGGRPR